MANIQIEDEPNKIYIIGDRGVGKTTLVSLLNDKQFQKTIVKSAISINPTPIEINNKKFTLKDLTDDKKEHKMTKILKDEIENVLCVIALFSLDNKESFDYSIKILQYVMDGLSNGSILRILLVGNKLDLIEEDNSKRQVTEDEIQAMVNKIPNSIFINISCKNCEGIENIINDINNLEIPGNDEEEEEEVVKKDAKKGGSCIIF